MTQAQSFIFKFDFLKCWYFILNSLELKWHLLIYVPVLPFIRLIVQSNWLIDLLLSSDPQEKINFLHFRFKVSNCFQVVIKAFVQFLSKHFKILKEFQFYALFPTSNLHSHKILILIREVVHLCLISKFVLKVHCF